MNDTIRLDLITAAAEDLGRVRRSLDLSTYPCDGCGRHRHRYWQHKLLATALDGALSRLEKAIDTITGTGAPERPAKETG